MYIIHVHAKKPAKLLLFFDMTKYFLIFFVKKVDFIQIADLKFELKANNRS